MTPSAKLNMAITLPRQRSLHPLQRPLATYAILKRKREALETIKKSMGSRLQRFRLGPARSRPSLSFTTIPNSSASIPSPADSEPTNAQSKAV